MPIFSHVKPLDVHAFIFLFATTFFADNLRAEGSSTVEDVQKGMEITTTNNCKLTLSTAFVPDEHINRLKWKTWGPTWNGRCFSGKALGYGTLSMESPDIRNGRRIRHEITGMAADGVFLGLALYEGTYTVPLETSAPLIQKDVLYFATGGPNRYLRVPNAIVRTKITPELIRNPGRSLELVAPSEVVATGAPIYIGIFSGHLILVSGKCGKPKPSDPKQSEEFLWCAPGQVGDLFKINAIQHEKFGEKDGYYNMDFDSVEKFNEQAVHQLAKFYLQIDKIISANEWGVKKIIENLAQKADLQDKEESEVRQRAEVIERINMRNALANAARLAQAMETGSAGQLFSLADELRERGQTESARTVLRKVLTKYSEHPLAVEAARLLRELPPD